MGLGQNIQTVRLRPQMTVGHLGLQESFRSPRWEGKAASIPALGLGFRV